MKVGAVLPDSPAERAGLRPGDRIVAVNGQKVENLGPFYEAIVVGKRDVVELTVEQPGSAGERRRLELALRPEKPAPVRMTRWEHLLNLSLDYYPLGFLIVGVGVLLSASGGSGHGNTGASRISLGPFDGEWRSRLHP
jgi:membrane-associated protease RseP (regulator of RpoE activity)